MKKHLRFLKKNYDLLQKNFQNRPCTPNQRTSRPEVVEPVLDGGNATSNLRIIIFNNNAKKRP